MTKQNKQWLIIVILIIGLGSIICIVGVNVATTISARYTNQEVKKAEDKANAFTIQHTDKTIEEKVLPLFDSIYVELKKINN